MATVRITDDVIKSMQHSLVKSREPGKVALVSACPTEALISIYSFIMHDDLLKQLNDLPLRYRPDGVTTVYFNYKSIECSIGGPNFPQKFWAGNNGAVYPMTSTYQHEAYGALTTNRNHVYLCESADHVEEPSGKPSHTYPSQRSTFNASERYRETVGARHQEAIDYFTSIKDWSAETTSLSAKLKEFLLSQPSLNKAVAAMPAIVAFIPSDLKTRLDQRTERQKRTEAKADETTENKPAVSAADMTALVMAAASTRV